MILWNINIRIHHSMPPPPCLPVTSFFLPVCHKHHCPWFNEQHIAINNFMSFHSITPFWRQITMTFVLFLLPSPKQRPHWNLISVSCHHIQSFGHTFIDMIVYISHKHIISSIYMQYFNTLVTEECKWCKEKLPSSTGQWDSNANYPDHTGNNVTTFFPVGYCWDGFYQSVSDGISGIQHPPILHHSSYVPQHSHGYHAWKIGDQRIRYLPLQPFTYTLPQTLTLLQSCQFFRYQNELLQRLPNFLLKLHHETKLCTINTDIPPHKYNICFPMLKIFPHHMPSALCSHTFLPSNPKPHSPPFFHIHSLGLKTSLLL